MASAAKSLKKPNELTGSVGPIDFCPTCSGRNFVLLQLNDAVAFQCQGCDSVWRYELGYVWPVHPGGESV